MSAEHLPRQSLQLYPLKLILTPIPKELPDGLMLGSDTLLWGRLRLLKMPGAHSRRFAGDFRDNLDWGIMTPEVGYD